MPKKKKGGAAPAATPEATPEAGLAKPELFEALSSVRPKFSTPPLPRTKPNHSTVSLDHLLVVWSTPLLAAPSPGQRGFLEGASRAIAAEASSLF